MQPHKNKKKYEMYPPQKSAVEQELEDQGAQDRTLGHTWTGQLKMTFVEWIECAVLGYE